MLDLLIAGSTSGGGVANGDERLFLRKIVKVLIYVGP